MRANTLGAGLLEKVYENALAHELTKVTLLVRQQIAIGGEDDGVTAGAYGAGILVENAVLVEIKAVRALDPEPRRSMPGFLFGRPAFRCACR
jgi:GxxExxY protein